MYVCVCSRVLSTSQPLARLSRACAILPSTMLSRHTGTHSTAASKHSSQSFWPQRAMYASMQPMRPMCQCKEASGSHVGEGLLALIPFCAALPPSTSHHTTRNTHRGVVMVGDPQQLPATIFSQVGKQLALERSLFERLAEVSEMCPRGTKMGRKNGGSWSLLCYLLSVCLDCVGSYSRGCGIQNM